MTKKKPFKIRAIPKKHGRVISISKKQIGKSVYKKDYAKKAMPPGLRISKDGHKYYEHRKNRSDILGKRI